MKKLPYLLLLSMLTFTGCSKGEDSPIDTAKAKAEEYVSLIRSLDPSLAKLTFDGVYEKTMTSYEEYDSYWTNIVNNRDNPPIYPIADLNISKTKFYGVLSFLAMSSSPKIFNVEANDKFYEISYKLSPDMQGGWRFIVVISKDMQVLSGCAYSDFTTTTKECLQNVFNNHSQLQN
jgi:hypothetical protein